ncbi:MAG TPA: hypothetical protein VLG28_06725 [Acidimicrobiia bacterium]|nr:hypothetical protein [Acidimicrobiia bacterium]
MHVSERVAERRAPFASMLGRDEWPALIALPALCSVIVLAVPLVGWWALALAVGVYAMGFRSFVVARSADATYSQLVTSLGRIAELNGAVPAGHVVRAADLALLMGERLELSEYQLATLCAAAHVRTAGLVGREDPPHYRPGFGHRSVVRWTQAIVGADGRLGEVAELVDGDESGVLGDVIATAATYDEAVHGMGMTPAAAFGLVSRDAPPDEAAVSAALGAVLIDQGVVLRQSVLESGSALAVDAVAK